MHKNQRYLSLRKSTSKLHFLGNNNSLLLCHLSFIRSCIDAFTTFKYPHFSEMIKNVEVKNYINIKIVVHWMFDWKRNGYGLPTGEIIKKFSNYLL